MDTGQGRERVGRREEDILYQICFNCWNFDQIWIWLGKLGNGERILRITAVGLSENMMLGQWDIGPWSAGKQGHIQRDSQIYFSKIVSSVLYNGSHGQARYDCHCQWGAQALIVCVWSGLVTNSATLGVFCLLIITLRSCHYRVINVIQTLDLGLSVWSSWAPASGQWSPIDLVFCSLWPVLASLDTL